MRDDLKFSTRKEKGAIRLIKDEVFKIKKPMSSGENTANLRTLSPFKLLKDALFLWQLGY